MPSDPPNYITPYGYERIKRELDWIVHVERPKVVAEVSYAASLGDRSENAEYIYGKKRLREIDKRVRWLRKRLEQVRVVRPSARHEGKVFFSASVTVEDEEGEEQCWQIVGTDEADADAGRISVKAPLAKALLGRGLDDEVLVRRPRGDATFTIVAIDYDFEEEP